MTCIVGYVDENKTVWMGGDSCGSDSWTKDNYDNQKVFMNSDFIIGYTTSFRMGQLLEYKWNPLKKNSCQIFKEMSDYKFIVSEVVPSIISLFKDNGFIKEVSSEQTGGTFLLGFNGNLYCIQDDFAVLKRSRNYDSCGSGYCVALGSMYQNVKNNETNAEKILNDALSAASELVNGVFPPFIIIKLEKLEKIGE